MDIKDINWRKTDIPVTVIVKCKNCEYQGGFNSEGRHTCKHSLGLVVADDESFCSYGNEKGIGDYDAIYTVNIKEFKKLLEEYIDPYEIDGALAALIDAAHMEV